MNMTMNWSYHSLVILLSPLIQDFEVVDTHMVTPYSL